MPTKVQIIRNVSLEDRAIMAACDRLKLAAIGYGSVTSGADATPEMLRMALGSLCQASIHYYETLANRPIHLSVIMSRLSEDTQQRNALRIAAQAYASASRASAGAGTKRTGLIAMCHAAIRYVEDLLGVKSGSVTDRTLRLK